MQKFLSFLNDNHWYIIAAVLTFTLCLWAYGCESKVSSLLDDTKLVNRQELQVELEYIAGIAQTRISNLDKQDEIKQAIFDALVAIGEGGQINALGLVNLAATIAAISFGLNRNQKLKNALKTSTETT